MKKQTIKTDEGTFTVTELRMRDVLPLMEGDAGNLSLEMCKQAISNGSGKPIGEGFLDLSFTTGNKLMQAVNAVMGLGDDESGKG